MKKSLKPNVSVLETEIENKIAFAYLHYIAAKGRHLNIGQLLIDHFTSPPENTNTIINKNGNKNNPVS